MTPLERALGRKGKINYCDECVNFLVVDGWAYCKDSGKLISPIMVLRGQGNGPAYNCERAAKRGEELIFAKRLAEVLNRAADGDLRQEGGGEFNSAFLFSEAALMIESLIEERDMYKRMVENGKRKEVEECSD